MANRLISPQEAAEGFAEIVNRHTEGLTPGERADVFVAIANWLGGFPSVEVKDHGKTN